MEVSIIWYSMVNMVKPYIGNSAGTNVYFPHSKVPLLKRTNVRMFVLLGLLFNNEK